MSQARADEASLAPLPSHAIQTEHHFLQHLMEVRRRNRPAPSPTRSARRNSEGERSRSALLDRGCTRIITLLFVAISVGLSTLSYCPDYVPSSVHAAVDRALGLLGLEEKLYAVVIDAGSTGSRVLAFTFHRGLFDRRLRLDDELWLQVKPGLSSYAEAPAQAGASLEGLLERAKERIPASSWASTPLTLKATAGLRLLPPAQSQAILTQVERTLRASGFRPEANLIEIMNPMEEGLFGWFTVNFLTHHFSSGGIPDSLASLDLGGGSTQVTFAPTQYVEDLTGRKHYMHAVSVLQKSIDVYSHSYLGLGLMTARQAIFQADHQSALQSPCVSGAEPLTWSFQGRDYVIASQQPSFDQCLKLTRAVIARERVHVPGELKQRRIAAFSYFYDKAKERGLISTEGTEGVIKLADYGRAAREACESAASEFYCVDLTFIYVLLSDGYGLADEQEILLYKKINNHEVSWALGLAYNILERV